MRIVVQTVTGVGVSNPIPMDQYLNPFNVGFGCYVTGTATYSVQHSFDNPFSVGYNPATAVWFNHPDVDAQTANADGNYAFPVLAIRLNVTAGTGSVQLNMIQAGVVGG
jgi:hypothetical protein